MSNLSKAIRAYREAHAANTEARAAMSARLKAREATKGTHAYQEARQRHTIAVAEATRAKQAADRAWYDFTAGALAEDRDLPQLHLRYQQAAQALERAFSEQHAANRALAVFDAWTDEDARCAERGIESRRAVEAAIATLKMAALASK